MSQDIRTYLEAAVKNGAADLFIVSGLPVSMKLDGRIVRQDETMVMPEEANRLISQIYELVWNDPSLGSESTVAVHIRHLREKIEINPADPRYLKAVWGQGYKIEKSLPAPDSKANPT